MLWVLWVQVTFTTMTPMCMTEFICLAPFTTTSQVRTYATEEACRQDIGRTREEFETLWAFMDHLKAEHDLTPSPGQLLPSQRTYTLWCAPDEKRKR